MNLFTKAHAAILEGDGLTKDSISDLKEDSGLQGLYTEGDAFTFALSMINTALLLVAFIGFVYLVFLGIRLLVGAADMDEVKGTIGKVVIGLIVIMTSYALINTLIDSLSTGGTIN